MVNPNDNSDNLSKTSNNNGTEKATSKETDTATTKIDDNEVESIYDTKNLEGIPKIDDLANLVINTNDNNEHLKDNNNNDVVQRNQPIQKLTQRQLQLM